MQILFGTYLVDWFLRRYDLNAASAILRVVTQDKLKPDKSIANGLGHMTFLRIWKPFSLSVLLLLFLCLSAGGYLCTYQPFSMEWMPSLPLFRENRPTNIQIWQVLPYAVGSALLLLAALWVCIWSWRKRRLDNLKRLLPRLMGGILVGYVPLMSAGDPWKWLLQMQTFPAVFLWAVMLLASVTYLYIEAHNTLTESELSETMRRECWTRVLHVSCIGLSEALIVGLILSELFGETVILSLLDDIKKGTQVITIAGWIGYVFPKVILLYAPLALFLGILVQLIWEEKTVTQPL